MKNKGIKVTPEAKLLKKLFKRIAELRKDSERGHCGPHLVGNSAPEWEISCYEYANALDDVEQVLLTELVKHVIL